MKTLAAVLERVNEPLEIRELALPDLLRGQVLVKVYYAGLCHSQLNEIRGKRGVDAYLPHTLGHEGSGVVVAVGPDVEKVKVDDPVVLSWIKGSGIDCKGPSYQDQRGVVNSGPISTFMEHTVVAENRLTVIPQDISLLDASLLGCAVATGGGIIRHDMNVKKGDSLAIFGVGGIGLSALMIASQMGVYPLIALDVHDSKLELARLFGATHCINVTKSKAMEEVRTLTDGKGVDFSLEAVGRVSVIEQAFQSVRAGGGLCVVAGNVPYQEKIQIDPYDLIKGKRIIGSWGGGADIEKDVSEYISWNREGKLKLQNLVTHQFDLNSINEAFRVLEEGQAGRVVLSFQ